MNLNIEEMKLEELDLLVEKWNSEKNEVKNLTLEQVELRTKQLERIGERRAEILAKAEERKKMLEEINNDSSLKVIATWTNPNERKDINMETQNNQEFEVRSLQKYVTQGVKNMNEAEIRALDTTGSAVVIPSTVTNKLITEEKYSTLLSKATIFNDRNAGKLTIPIASANAAVWKDENANADSESISYEKSPTLTNIVLGGHELYRWMRMSAAAHSMSSSEFEGMMLNLLASEVVEELEKTFVQGTGVGQPTGLEALVYTDDVNAIEVANGTAISPKDVADAIALLPAKYARESIVMCNTGTLADIALFKGTSEFAYNLSDGASKFLGHEIVVNEHVDDDVIYVVDPKELYVRFAMPIQVEANRSSGFTSASVDLRALTVVDAAWNAKAVSKVYVKATE